MTTSDTNTPLSPGPWMRAVLSELDGPMTAVRTFDGDWSGRELLHRAGGAARFPAAVGLPGCAIPALIGSSATSMALTLGGAFSDHPIAPLGTRLAVAELAPLVKALGAPMLVADRPNAEHAAQTAVAA